MIENDSGWVEVNNVKKKGPSNSNIHNTKSNNTKNYNSNSNSNSKRNINRRSNAKINSDVNNHSTPKKIKNNDIKSQTNAISSHIKKDDVTTTTNTTNTTTTTNTAADDDKNDDCMIESVFNKINIVKDNENTNDDNNDIVGNVIQDVLVKNDHIYTVKEFCTTSRDILKQCMNIDNGIINISNSRCVGLVNTGNTCYRNCILQILLSIPQLYNMMNRLIDSFVLSNLPDQLKSWRQLLVFTMEYKNKIYKNGKLISALSKDIPVLNPELFLKDLFETFKAKVHPNGVPTITITSNGKDKKNGKGTRIISSQEDAQEFLNFVLDTLDEEMNCIPEEDDKETDEAILTEESGWETVNKPRVKEVVDDISREDAIRKSTSTLISRLFHGTLRSEVIYTNKKISSRFQIINQIQIELLELLGRERKPIINDQQTQSSKTDKSSINISDAVKLYFAEEDLDNGAKKRFKLENAPQLLILHLKRFSFDYSRNIPIKINNEVNYDINLTIPIENLTPDLMAKCIKSNGNNDNNSDNDDIPNIDGIRYRLIGLILHHGIHATGGHYTAITKETDISWKSMDDSTGSFISHNEALDGKKQVYLLFYEKL